MTPIEFCKNAVQVLQLSSNFGEDYVKLKMDFYSYHHPYVFSTRFGAEFFDETLRCLLNKETIKAGPNEKLGMYDENFNVWIKKSA
jgi:hypothetical protein